MAGKDQSGFNAQHIERREPHRHSAGLNKRLP